MPEPVNTGLNIGQGSCIGPTLYILMESVCKLKLQAYSNIFFLYVYPQAFVFNLGDVLSFLT